MAYRITNNSQGPRGIHNHVGRLVFIEPGETKMLDVAHIDGVKRHSFLSVEIDDSDLPSPPASLAAAVRKQSAKPRAKATRTRAKAKK